MGITLVAYASTSPLQAFSSSQTILLSALPSEPTAINDMEPTETIVSPPWSIISCKKTHPVSCIYSNRGLVSHLEQEFVEQKFVEQELSTLDRPSERPAARQTSDSPPEQNQEVINTSHQSVDINDINRQIRILTQLKNWLDTISPVEPIEQI